MTGVEPNNEWKKDRNNISATGWILWRLRGKLHRWKIEWWCCSICMISFLLVHWHCPPTPLPCSLLGIWQCEILLLSGVFEWIFSGCWTSVIFPTMFTVDTLVDQLKSYLGYSGNIYSNRHGRVGTNWFCDVRMVTSSSSTPLHDIII